MRIVLSLALAIALNLLSLGGVRAMGATIVEAGSTLMYPLMNVWVAAFQKTHPAIAISTQSTGSETGITQAMYGIAQIGASDAYMSDQQMQKATMLNIALAVSAQQVNFNIPGLNDARLNLSGPVLAAIYSGQVLTWDDPAIRVINPEIASKLPHQPIVPINRADGSGDTFIFTQYLALTAPVWHDQVGFGTKILWPPTPRGVAAIGNTGMLESCRATPYSLAYIGISYLAKTQEAHLGYAWLLNRAGKYVPPTPASIAAAVKKLEMQTPADERMSLIDAPGPQSYPIVNFEYAIVNPHQSEAALKDGLVAFLRWAIDPSGGNNAHYLDETKFLPLPDRVRTLSEAQIASIK